jgi:hypothetical protein
VIINHGQARRGVEPSSSSISWQNGPAVSIQLAQLGVRYVRAECTDDLTLTSHVGAFGWAGIPSSSKRSVTFERRGRVGTSRDRTKGEGSVTQRPEVHGLTWEPTGSRALTGRQEAVSIGQQRRTPLFAPRGETPATQALPQTSQVSSVEATVAGLVRGFCPHVASAEIRAVIHGLLRDAYEYASAVFECKAAPVGRGLRRSGEHDQGDPVGSVG